MADIIGAKLAKKIKNLITRKEVEALAEIGRDAIKTRTRLGYGVSDDGAQKKKLKKLSDSYKQFRRGKIAFYTDDNGVVHPVPKPKKKPKLHSETTPTRSNLTMTGQMLDSMDYRVKSSSFEVTISGNRQDGKANNAEVAEFVQDQGRPFLFFSKAELSRLTRELKLMILKKLEKT